MDEINFKMFVSENKQFFKAKKVNKFKNMGVKLKPYKISDLLKDKSIKKKIKKNKLNLNENTQRKLFN